MGADARKFRERIAARAISVAQMMDTVSAQITGQSTTIGSLVQFFEAALRDTDHDRRILAVLKG